MTFRIVIGQLFEWWNRKRIECMWNGKALADYKVFSKSKLTPKTDTLMSLTAARNSTNNSNEDGSKFFPCQASR